MEGRAALAWSWRRVYCHEVTPGALNMKRRALVMRKPACGDRMGVVLVPSPREGGTELKALALPFTPLAHSDPPTCAHSHLAGP